MKELRYIGVRPEGKHGTRGWALYYCEHCGRRVERNRSNGQKAKSCGCVPGHGDVFHGECNTKLYHVWASMLWRCRKPVKRYGARGIAVCAAWQSYVTFRDWALAHGYREGLYIDRIDNNGDYSPENCHWITSKQSAKNRTSRWD